MENYNAQLADGQKEILKNLIGKSIDSWGIKIVEGNSDYELTYFSAKEILVDIKSDIFLRISFIEKKTSFERFTYFEPIVEYIEESDFYNTSGFCISPSYYNKITLVETYTEEDSCPAAQALYEGVIVIHTDKGTKFCFRPMASSEEEPGVYLTIINPPEFYEKIHANLNRIFGDKNQGWKTE